ncbi:MAG: phosphoribosyl-AMP cyclohydrolase [Gammaproteobacteria bacterium]|nr:phosphoribosyl-AMP cyclohydrolase [Gammaproteobacteria bacterium]MCY4198404.1 phosphoribosyl-AMP cyclohydrolase [Gammaproteobacteria bacterium]MCY4278860.1 phosphoribosyl-AMP cyclohydrolase [Gammaproteobacteria bacterium]MCY4322744.1 phosphoribosyl-AMP cyclohydrolase [Gammaproteobacteria bacterium]
MSGLFKQLEAADDGARVDLESILSEIKFNADGLVPAIAQAADSGKVLMLAWMNIDALRETIQSGRVCYFSRSRNALWRKGETSGHTQLLVSLRIDCDGDTILLEVEQAGPACHTNRPSCFYLHLKGDSVEVRAGV